VDIAYSINDIPIRLTTERWYHIVENHDDMAGHYDDVLETIETPDVVLRGYKGALIAVRGAGRSYYLCVVYREIGKEDGFVISAFFTSEINKRNQIWLSKH
jgi:hypothetical protein